LWQETTMSVAESFGRSGFARFINTSSGRVARVVVGAVLIAWGYLWLDGTAGIVLIVVGLIPLVAGALNLCLISAMLGGPIRGDEVGARVP
jgi:hypothetical protein